MTATKAAIALAPLALPAVAYAQTRSLSATDNVIPYSPVQLPVWAWIVIGCGASLLLWKRFK